MSSTLTQVQGRSEQLPEVVLRLQPAFERLTPIIRKYKQWNDHLSLQIGYWWIDARRCKMQGLSESAALGSIHEKVDRLRHFILVDCLTRKPLGTALLVHGWTWDSVSLSRYETLFDRFDGKPLLPRQPHDFANEVLQWAKSMPDTVSQCTALVPQNAPTETSSPLGTALRVLTYSALEQRAIQLKREQRESASMNGLQNALAGLELRLREQRLAHLQELRQENAEHEVRVMQSIDTLKELQASRVNVLHEQLDGQERRNNETKAIDAKTIGTLSENVKETREQLTATSEKLTQAEQQVVQLHGAVCQLSAQNAELARRQSHLENELNNRSDCVIS